MNIDLKERYLVIKILFKSIIREIEEMLPPLWGFQLL